MSEPAFFRRPETDLPLFTPEPPVPSVARPGSEAAADLILNSPLRRKSWRRILLYLATQHAPVSREQISESLDVPQHCLTGRIAELAPQLIVVTEGACKSRAGIAVQGYALSDAGRARVAEAQAVR